MLERDTVFELFSQLKLSSELRLKLLGAAITTACIQRETRAIDLAVTVKTALEASDIDELISAIRNDYSFNAVDIHATLKEAAPADRQKAAPASGSHGGEPRWGGFNGEYH